jgi:hypothetical protein
MPLVLQHHYGSEGKESMRETSLKNMCRVFKNFNFENYLLKCWKQGKKLSTNSWRIFIQFSNYRSFVSVFKVNPQI